MAHLWHSKELAAASECNLEGVSGGGTASSHSVTHVVSCAVCYDVFITIRFMLGAWKVLKHTVQGGGNISFFSWQKGDSKCLQSLYQGLTTNHSRELFSGFFSNICVLGWKTLAGWGHGKGGFLLAMEFQIQSKCDCGTRGKGACISFVESIPQTQEHLGKTWSWGHRQTLEK